MWRGNFLGDNKSIWRNCQDIIFETVKSGFTPSWNEVVREFLKILCEECDK